jgi:hypothetical protein
MWHGEAIAPMDPHPAIISPEMADAVHKIVKKIGRKKAICP